jgi:excisionase family DNA binding protein
VNRGTLEVDMELSVKELAVMANISTSLIYTLIKQNKLPYQLRGGRYFFNSYDVMHLLPKPETGEASSRAIEEIFREVA